MYTDSNGRMRKRTICFAAMLNMSICVMIPLLMLSTPVASTAVNPPKIVASTDELYKPATLIDGTLIAVALPVVQGVQQMVAIYSSDNGKSWSQPIKLFSLPRDVGTFGYFDFLVDRTGELHFFFLLNPSTSSSWRKLHPKESTIGEAELDIWYLKSNSERTKWEAPKEIWQGRGGDLLSVIQLRGGRLLLPICYRTKRSWANRGSGFNAYIYRGEFDVSALYSDDNGATWHLSSSVLSTPTPDLTTIEGAVEPVVLQLKDGRVWMLIRTQMGRLYESFSSDDGKTWTPPVPTSLVSSDSPASLTRLSDGRIVMLLNGNLRYPYAYGGRHVLHAAVSDDDGKTWRGYREVVRDPLRQDPPPPGGDFGPAYPYPTVTRDDKVLFGMACATETRNADPNAEPGFVAKQKRDLVLIDTDWLLETSQRTDFSNGVSDWSAFGVKGVEVVPDPTRSNAVVLSIRKIAPDWPAAAVWNFPMAARGHLRMDLMIQPGFRGALIGLTDHYSVPFDGEDIFYNVYNFAIGTGGTLPEGEKLALGQWHQLDLDWDTAIGQGRIEIDGHPVGVVRMHRESEGISYVRLRSTAQGTDPAGFLVQSIEFTMTPTG